ncbi:MAG: hypothetical protein LBT37_01915 [Lactobacillaceae bacterium]|jgi:hypothetical protein|nr:hypothetical protein [Lactobacillaceae bacterium]
MIHNRKVIKKILSYALILTTVTVGSTFAKYISDPGTNTSNTLVSGFDFEATIQKTSDNGNVYQSVIGDQQPGDRYGQMDVTYNATTVSNNYEIRVTNTTTLPIRVLSITKTGAFNEQITIGNVNTSTVIQPGDSLKVADVVLKGADALTDGSVNLQVNCVQN